MASFVIEVVGWFSDLISLFLNIKIDEFMGKTITFGDLLMYLVALVGVLALLILGTKDVSFKNKPNNDKK